MQRPDSAHPTASTHLSAGPAYATILIAIRIGQLMALAWLTDKAEFASDIAFQRLYAADPLQLLLGRSTTYEVFPPLFPVVLWSLHTPLSWLLSPFYSMRMSMAVVELIAWPFVWGIIVNAASRRSRHLLAVTYIAAPMCWITTVVMCQDEVISMLFFAAVVVAVLKEKTTLAAFLCGVGVVVAKVYFLVPLVGILGITLQHTWKQWWRVPCVGIAPILLVYGIQALLTGHAGHVAESFADFVIPFQMCVNVWTLIGEFTSIDSQQARLLSAAIALPLSILPLVLMRLRRQAPTPIEQVQVLAAMMLWVYTAFYHINPEYYMIVVPAMFVALRPVVASLVLVIGFSLPWAVNFFYGVGIGIKEGGAGRSVFVRLYQTVFAIDPAILHSVSIVLSAGMTLWLAVLLTWKVSPRRITSQTQFS